MNDLMNQWLILVIIGHSSAIFYNVPKLSPCATWNSNGITFANESTIGSIPLDAFIDLNNTVYVAAQSLNRIVVWSYNSTTPTQIISDGLYTPQSIFVTNNGDIYIDNFYSNHRVDKWTSNTMTGVSTMNVAGRCISLFIDMNNTLYCSDDTRSTIFKTSLNNDSNGVTIAAGNGTAGSGANLLHRPGGIFVDFNLNLYVADWGNDRIQRFRINELNGTTIAGEGASGTIILDGPTDVVLDADGDLFVTDAHNHRIVRVGPTGSHCIVGCTNTTGTASNQLNHPQTLVFDSYGNLFVVELKNNRIQTFFLATNSCDISLVTSESTMTDVMTTTAMSHQSCFVPVLNLIPEGSSLASPVEFQRNDDFFISSNIRWRCNNSFPLTTIWTIQTCTSNCSEKIELDQLIPIRFSDFYIPPRTLSVGLYQLTLTVTLKQSPQLTSSSSVYVRVLPSGIQVNLVQLGTSMITRGYTQILTLNPGEFSIDFDAHVFNASDWIYQYYYQIVGYPTSPNQSQIAFSPLKSSLTIASQFLLPNRTYQFLVHLSNRQNSSRQSTGSLLVEITDADSELILVACVIPTMCVSTSEYQRINPTTQVALFSLCSGACTSMENITWNIYQGMNNISTSMINWRTFNSIDQYENIWFFGRNTANLTIIHQLFANHPDVEYWRFEAIYSSRSSRSAGSIAFVLNPSPVNGFCSIDPLNGTSTTLFTIICSNWSDSDGIKDYSFYVWTTDRLKLSLVAFTSMNSCELRLPAGNGNTFLLHLVARIRDRFGAIAEFNMSSITVLPDTPAISNLINAFQNSSMNDNPLVGLLEGGNVNTVGQVISSVSQILNEINRQNIDRAISSGVSATSISVTSFDDDSSSVLLNESNLQINTQANLRDYLMEFTEDLIIGNVQSIEIQASSLAQLTQATNQLTRKTALLASKRCYQFAVILHSIRLNIPFKSVKTTATQISTCATNVLTAIHGPLQAEQITFETTQTISLLTSALNVHLNIGQNLTMSSSSIFISLEKRTFKSISNQSIQQMGKGRIRMPANFDRNQIILLRSMIQPLAIADESQSMTNLSRAISLSILDRDGKEISVNPFEIIIPRDPNVHIPDMILQDVLSISQDQVFNLHQIDITSTLTISVHLEIQPLNPNMSYLFIYKFDGIPQWNAKVKVIDGWTVFCSSSEFLFSRKVTNGTIYKYFLDNEQTAGHRSIVFGLRELNQFDRCSHLSRDPPMINEKSNFTSNYQMRIYTSGCYYLDENHQWKSDGLKVGPLTNHYQTQCFSTHA